MCLLTLWRQKTVSLFWIHRQINLQWFNGSKKLATSNMNKRCSSVAMFWMSYVNRRSEIAQNWKCWKFQGKHRYPRVRGGLLLDQLVQSYTKTAFLKLFPRGTFERLFWRNLKLQLYIWVLTNGCSALVKTAFQISRGTFWGLNGKNNKIIIIFLNFKRKFFNFGRKICRWCFEKCFFFRVQGNTLGKK